MACRQVSAEGVGPAKPLVQGGAGGVDGERHVYDRRGSGDEGAVLPTVLAFITVIGVIVGALLGQAAANFQATSVLRDHRDRMFAADAGLEWVFARSAAITASLNPTEAPNCTQTISVNGAAVSLACSGNRDRFTVTSTAVKQGTSVATAVFERTDAAFVPREWHTATE